MIAIAARCVRTRWPQLQHMMFLPCMLRCGNTRDAACGPFH
ncbi:hypothetical protein IB69_004980 [Xanthomonas citri]|uniref:Uncharacterized protein n=1 Tax=Xanthomonas phaseoli pv. dieffenbachiae TaxID=92828 RepID=A0A1V9GVL1_9XANT|nr:hypothetical protein IM53_020920 [Xanthomonas phaseoli pv. dieffenbachiae]OQP79820.1 hypothetical protein IB69_004980 [Xanthomonas citri]